MSLPLIITHTRMAVSALVAATAIAGLAVNPAATGEAAASPKIRTKTVQRADDLRDRIAAIATAQRGDRYVLGATGPGAFDCSGLVNFTYRKATGKKLPRTSYQLAGSLNRVSKKHRKVGDIALYRGNGHVGIYIGRGRIAQALNSRTGVIVGSADRGWNRSMIYAYGRVIHTQ